MWFTNLLFSPGVAHSVLLVAATIAIGLAMSRIKIGGISLGVTWVLFVGIVASHFGLVLDATTSHFVKEFGLILFIYSIGLQVGPSFFSSFRTGGITLNLLATGLVLLGALTAYIIHVVTGEDLCAMIGVLYGAVTNTPGLGAAQQTYSDMHGGEANSIFAQGYAVAYPLGVVGIILSIVLIRYFFRINMEKEQQLYNINNRKESETLQAVTLEVTNDAVVGKTMAEVQQLSGRNIVATRLQHRDTEDIVLIKGETRFQMGDKLFLVAKPKDVEAYTMIFGRKLEKIDQEVWDKDKHNELVSERIVVTNSKLQGKRLGDLNLRATFHVTITRVKRAGIDLIAEPSLILQLGDRVTVVGSKENVQKIEGLLGNSVQRLDHPQLFSIFLGITLGVLLGSLPIFFPGMPVPVKLGLAGGPLIVSILLSCYGPKFRIITYTTASAKLLMREIGISLFMAAVGLGAGVGFVDTVMNGGYWWVLYGFIITFLPCIIIGIVARVVFHRSYFTIAGMISGATTDPPALAYSNSICGNDQASVAYSTVYPLTMFLRVLVAQVLVLMAL
ncbi:MAG: putative transporter [Bacteroidales bacterium]|nr:putative transporter [Bacteroidales bacterium]